jgi:hypothetical protein
MIKRTRFAYRKAAFLALPVALMAFAGCSHNGDRPMFTRTPGQGDKVTIHADNQNFLDADVYALWNGQRDRLGMVTGKSTQTFDVPFRDNDLQLQIDFVGSGVMTTDHITVWQGDQVDVVIPPTR